MGSGQKFVPNGVMLRCSSGTAPGTLRVIPKPVKLSGQIFATEMDTIPFVNIPMFGGCRNKPYCAPCTPIPSGWQNVCSDGVKVFGARPLLANSSNSCGLGGRITISNVMSAGGGGGFSSMFASVTSTGMPDVSALSGAGSSVPIQANPMSAIANVGGVASLAGGGLPPMQALTNVPTNISNLPSVTNIAAVAQNSGLANAMRKVGAGMEQVKGKFDQLMGKAQGFVDKGQQFLGKATDFAGKLNQYGGVASKLLGNDKLQKALQKWTDKLQNVQNEVRKVVSKFNTYKDAALKGMTYLTKASTFLSNFSKQLGSGALAAKWNAFKSQLGQRAKTFFSQIKQGVDKLKNQKYPDTIGGWLKMAQSGFSDLSDASKGLSKGFNDAKSYLAGASEGIKTFGGVVSTLTGNPYAKEALEKWADELDKVGNKVGDAASKAEKAAEILKKGADFSKKAADFFEKDKKSGGLKEQWEAWSQKMGGQAGAFFDTMKNKVNNLKNMKTPDSVSGWLAVGGTGLSDLSGLFGKTNNGIKYFKNIISSSAGSIRSFGGIVSSVTGNKWLEQWAGKWDHAANQVNQVATRVADYQDKLKTGGEMLHTGSKYAQKAADFLKKFKTQLPSGSPFQNWGSSISNWVTALKNQSFELPKIGSVKELLGDLEKLSGNLGVGLDKVSELLGKGDSGLTTLAGMVGLFNKDTAAKLKKWAEKVSEFKEKAKKAAETARKIKEQLSKVTQKIADFKAKWKKGVEKAKAFWAKMKAKFPKFNKGLDLSRQTLPLVLPVAKLAVPTVQSVQAAQVAALSPVPIPPVALPPNVAVANSAAAPAAGAVKGGSVKVSVSVSGSGVINGTSRAGTVSVTKPNLQLPDMSDKNAPKAKPAVKPPVKPKVPVKPQVPAKPTVVAPKPEINKDKIDWKTKTKQAKMCYVMTRLVEKYHFPVEGAAGLVGNLYAESGLIPNRIEGSSVETPMRARNFGGTIVHFTASEIKARVYKTSTGPKLPGAGIAQWTSKDRRDNFFNQPLKENILFDMDAQLDFLVSEMKSSYSNVNKKIRDSDTSIGAASDIVVTKFERPADQSEKHLAVRRGYGQDAYNAYKNKECAQIAKKINDSVAQTPSNNRNTQNNTGSSQQIPNSRTSNQDTNKTNTQHDAAKKLQQQMDNEADSKKREEKKDDSNKKTGEGNIDISVIQCMIPGKLGKLVPLNVCFESKGTELKVSIPIDVGKVFSATPTLNFKKEAGKPIVVGELELCAGTHKIEKVISMVSKTSEIKVKGNVCVTGNTQGEFKLAANADAESAKFDTSIQIKIQNRKITEIEGTISGEYKGGYWAGGKVEGKFKQQVDIDIAPFIESFNEADWVVFSNLKTF